MPRTTAINREQIFNYLDMVKRSGVVNMFEAGPFIESAFDLSPQVARRYLTEWMAAAPARNPNSNDRPAQGN